MTAEIEKAYQKKIAGLETAIAQKDASIRKLLIESAFNSSQYIKEKTVLIPEIALDFLGKHFHFEEVDGELKAFAVDSKGNKIFSLRNAGEYADPEEAIELLINSHPQKGRILKRDASASGGGGTVNNSGIKNPFKKCDSFNLTEQGKLIRQNPALAKRLAAEAGITLDLK